ncbi:SIMPL domain-containing protein [Georgenia sp. Z1491]|uniref:SIMPL domain-containing protein n=1 Tax=Georgenia sp. Z1491 TaxID=3416707 RepID=UPI003CFB5595
MSDVEITVRGSHRRFHPAERGTVHARADLQVKFRDFDRLSAWLREMSTVTGFVVDRVAWSLTEVRKAELVREARVGAVTNARDKAGAYAAALGLATVTPLEVADAGMLGDDRRAENEDAVPFARAAALGSAGEPDLRLVPEDIEITAKVDARFVASGG